MAKVNVSVPQGTRDFDASTVKKRQYIFNTIKAVFEKYGFAPLETPAMENLDTLMGKYGDEGDKLIFKILNNGLNKKEKVREATAAFENVLVGKNDKNLTERALKYDLTIPFARYVAMNHTTLTFPFKRYQIQPVWRADRPQKGRYREFYQCDADVVGSTSLWNEVEFINIYANAFDALQMPVTIKINNRKILSALAKICGGAKNTTAITVAIDKLDKIGIEKVKEELATNGIENNYINTIEKYLLINGSNTEKLNAIKNLLGNNAEGEEGINDLTFLLEQTSNSNFNAKIELDFTLARGLNYYTGAIFEIKAEGVQMGSIGGGGRYDNLTESFGVPNVPGVGISFGVDRIYDVMTELNLFPDAIGTTAKLLIFNLGEENNATLFQIMQQLRAKGVAVEMLFENMKIDKQFKIAEKKNIPFVLNKIEEGEEKKYSIKNITKGEVNVLTEAELLNFSF